MLSGSVLESSLSTAHLLFVHSQLEQRRWKQHTPEKIHDRCGAVFNLCKKATEHEILNTWFPLIYLGDFGTTLELVLNNPKVYFVLTMSVELWQVNCSSEEL